VEAAGVEPDKATENTQLVDCGNARIGTNYITSKSAVRSLYSVLPEFPEHPTSTFGRLRSTKSILKFVSSISQVLLGRSGDTDSGSSSESAVSSATQPLHFREFHGQRAPAPLPRSQINLGYGFTISRLAHARPSGQRTDGRRLPSSARPSGLPG
jgi:hypothetical protein